MFIFEQLRPGGDRNFAYLIGDRHAGDAAIVDPSYDPDMVIDRADDQKMTVRYIINTHGHADHTNGNEAARNRTGAKIVAHASANSDPDIAVNHEETLKLGELELKFLHTPGHCKDSICILVNDVLCTGDALFVGKIGGTATREGGMTQHRALHEVLLTLPDHVMVWPGHDYGCRPASTIGLERRNNPFLVAESLEAFMVLKKEWPTYKQEHGLK